MQYKLNKYLYQGSKNNNIIVYNLISGTIFALTKEKYDLLNTNNLSSLRQTHPAFFSAMRKLGVLIPIHFNEIDYVRMKNRQIIFDTRNYRLTINPTLECNFNCWYCYEEHPKGRMSQDVMNSIVSHIRRKIKEKTLQYLELDWFGGEPLLYFDEVMYPLGKEIKKVVEKNNISFANGATTNGFYIDDERIVKFKEIGLTNFQITLDGYEDTHNKVRFGKNKEGSFRKIIENINLLSENSINTIMVRINYTAKTLEKINDIINLFSEKAKKRVTILFQQVWQDSVKHIVSAEENKKIFEKEGFKVKKYELNFKNYMCYADLSQQAVINFDGRVFKCTARDFNTVDADGKLLSNGEIEWDIPLISKRLGNATFENEFCISCKLLPACMGPCSQKMMEFTKGGNFRKICLQDGIREIIEEEINVFHEKLKKI
jgi:uncharacterized protein